MKSSAPAWLILRCDSTLVSLLRLDRVARGAGIRGRYHRRDAYTCDQARGRAHAPGPAAGRLRCAGVRRLVRGAGGRARAGWRGDAGAGGRPLRAGRASDLCLRDADTVVGGYGSARITAPDVRRVRRSHAVSNIPLAAAVVVCDV